MGNLNQLDRNLLVFLDPVGRYADESWDFCDGFVRRKNASPDPARNLVLRFSRNQLIRYWIVTLRMLFGKKRNQRKILFVNDGLLSSFFDAGNVRVYRDFAKQQIPRPKGIRQRIAAFLPLVWRAEIRFIVIFEAMVDPSLHSELDAYNFMILSNAGGKLLLMTSEIVRSGHGMLVKTTANKEYVSVMQKEFDVVTALSSGNRRISGIPEMGKHFQTGGRHFFTEKFILGENLREKLRALGKRGDSRQVCSILDSLDTWFVEYQTSFVGLRVAIAPLYSHLFPLFSECYGATSRSLLETGKELLRQFDVAHSGIIPIISHNDLWPGNIVMTAHGFTVIDWERAQQHRAPFYDYFWMVVSTSIEFLASREPQCDYSEGVRIFLRRADEVSCRTFKMLSSFLQRTGGAEEYLPHLLFLFFMEWSVQGYQVLGKQTAMDRLAFGELEHFAKSMNFRQNEGWAEGNCAATGQTYV